MVVRLPKDTFTAGDMIITVRSRRKAKADPRFYGVGSSEMKKVYSKVKDSDEYLNVKPTEEKKEVAVEPSLESQVREESIDTLHERARQILKEIEADMQQINLKRSY